MKLTNWTMKIYAKDRRFKTGERLVRTYAYRNKHHGWMMEEISDLQAGLYPGEKFRFEALKVEPTGV